MDAAGVGMIVSGTVIGLPVVLGLWGRLSAPRAFALLAAAGMIVGAGALALQEDPGTADRVVTPIVLGVLTPLHARLVFGRPGRGG